MLVFPLIWRISRKESKLEITSFREEMEQKNGIYVGWPNLSRASNGHRCYHFYLEKVKLQEGR